MLVSEYNEDRLAELEAEYRQFIAELDSDSAADVAFTFLDWLIDRLIEARRTLG